MVVPGPRRNTILRSGNILKWHTLAECVNLALLAQA